MTYAMLFITSFGSPLSFYLLSLALIGLLWLHGKKQDAKEFFYLMSFSAILVLIIKEVVGRQRPLSSLISEIGYSFPSAHAMLALVFFLCIALYYESHFKNKILKNIFVILNIFMIAAISYSRVYLGVHYWSDVIGSLLIGSFIFILYRNYRRNRHAHHHGQVLIIGITGTNGSGKGTVVEILRKKLHFHYFSARGFLTPILENRGVEVNRPNMTELADELRKNFGPSYVTDQLLKEAVVKGGHSIIESFRAIGEVHSARALAKRIAEDTQKTVKFVLLDVESDAQSRYERIKKRGTHLDKVVSYEEFLAHDKREADSEESHRGNIQGCKLLADYKIENTGTFEQLEHKVEVFLKTLE